MKLKNTDTKYDASNAMIHRQSLRSIFDQIDNVTKPSKKETKAHD